MDIDENIIKKVLWDRTDIPESGINRLVNGMKELHKKKYQLADAVSKSWKKS